MSTDFAPPLAERSRLSLSHRSFLSVPDLSRAATTVAMIDSSTYSPFPLIPGSQHARDPYGLNAFLCLPEETLWSHAIPIDAPLTPGPQITSATRRKSSVNALSKPSPLGSQPPLGPEATPNTAFERGRSAKVVSAITPEKQDFDMDVPTPFTPNPVRDQGEQANAKLKSKSLGRKSLSRALSYARKSMVDLTTLSSTDVPPPVPSVPQLTPISTSSSSTLSTPMTSRSNSSQSALSSASSSSSSEGLQTPTETRVDTAEVETLGGPLAEALLQAEKRQARRGNWMGWFGGGRKGSKGSITPDKGDVAAEDTFRVRVGISKLSNLDSDRHVSQKDSNDGNSLTTLDLPIFTFTPSDSSHTESTSWITDMLYRSSIIKLRTIRQPSPHPLALSLLRQYSQLPPELAFSLQAGQRAFPNSVNPYLPSSTQNGLGSCVAIRGVLRKLNAGERPTLTEGAAHDSTAFTTSRPTVARKGARSSGMDDFISRPPFEERMLVFFPDGIYSPISMARPGYGVWDLDFSPYILTLADIHDMEQRNGSPRGTSSHHIVKPNPPLSTPISRTSSDPMIIGAERESAPVDTMSEVTVQEPVIVISPDADDELLVVQAENEQRIKGIARPGVSDFSIPSAAINPPEGDSQEGDGKAGQGEPDDHENDDDSDDEPLVLIARKRQQSQSRSRSSSPLSPALAPAPASSVVPTRRARLTPQQALAEVGRARERREASRSGETERQAEAERRRSSFLSEVSPHAGGDHTQRRKSSTANSRVSVHSNMSAGSSSDNVRPSSWRRSGGRRYSSFYEVPHQHPGQFQYQTTGSFYGPSIAMGSRISHQPNTVPRPMVTPTAGSAHFQYSASAHAAYHPMSITTPLPLAQLSFPHQPKRASRIA